MAIGCYELSCVGPVVGRGLVTCVPLSASVAVQASILQTSCSITTAGWADILQAYRC